MTLPALQSPLQPFAGKSPASLPIPYRDAGEMSYLLMRRCYLALLLFLMLHLKQLLDLQLTVRVHRSYFHFTSTMHEDNIEKHIANN